jgi:DNA-3-methyladenine glycosylase II
MGVVAERILARFTALTPGPRYPRRGGARPPRGVVARGGLLGRQGALPADIAEKTESGVIPSRQALARLGDEEIIERLITVRGVGRWTVEMLLIRLGARGRAGRRRLRPAAGFRAAYGTKELPTPKELRAFGERWRPFRTVAVLVPVARGRSLQAPRGH